MSESVRMRLHPNEAIWVEQSRKTEIRKLLIGDIHEPFAKDGYLQHCIETHNRFNCNEVVFMGDIVDNHYSSFHPTDPDGYGAGEELDRARGKIQQWYQAFPEAKVVWGNHDLLPTRKAFAGGLSGQWVKTFNEVLEIGDGWEFLDEYVSDGVLYVHGTGTSGMNAARKRALEANMSVAIGHIHTEASVNWHADREKRFFGMMVGCGVDEKSYAAAYGKNFPRRQIMSCGVVLDDGKLPIIVPMNL
jgi:hypothetical protein